jgi:Asp-tRNA(Asn)/Glu-tRNA(Gln) amidotransferase B subunit
MMDSRQKTNRLIELLDEGTLSYEQVCLLCLQHMSEDDVSDMIDANELTDLVDGGEYEPE